MLTGPNGSTSCGSTAPLVARSSTGERNAPRSASPSMTSTWSGSPYTIAADDRSDWSALRTSSRWPRLASAPMRTSGFAGLPTVIFASRSVIA